MPPAGSQPRCTAKIVINSRPIQKLGAAWPKAAASLTRWSGSRPRRVAASTPSGTAVSRMRHNDASWSLQAGGNAGADKIDDPLAVDCRASEIEGCHFPQENRELHRIGAIRANPLALRLDLGGRRIRWQRQRRRVSCKTRRDEQDDHEEYERDQRLKQTASDVLDATPSRGRPLVWKKLYRNMKPCLVRLRRAGNHFIG